MSGQARIFGYPMINSTVLIDRFGDPNFLHRLWLKARIELPKQTDYLNSMVRENEKTSDEKLALGFHKIRGLISNFLTEKTTMQCLSACEEALESGTNPELVESWEKFRAALVLEVKNLEDWLNSQGYSC